MLDYALRRRFAFFELKPGFGTEGFKAYQTELNNCEEQGGLTFGQAGMLLYAKTDEDIYPENEYRMSGNRIAVRTLNLDGDFDMIREQLDGIAASHFNQNTIAAV